MAAEYEAILRKIQEGLAQKDAEEANEEVLPDLTQPQQQLSQPQQQQPPPKPQPQPQQEPQLPSSPSFKQLYDHICQRIRSTGTLDTVMTEFQKLKTDLERVEYISDLSEVEGMTLEENYSSKSDGDAANYEKVYDMLIANESTASKAFMVMHKCLQKTPAQDTQALAVRYMKRGWASLLLEHFEDAERDARTSLNFQCPEDLLWNAHEVLGHCSARVHDYKASETHFHRALENLRKSNVVNEVKATATVRIMTVFKTVKAKKGKKVREDRDHDVKPVPQVSYGTHNTFISASSAMEFLVTEDRGRCAIAKRDIKPGDILIVDSAFSSMINPDFLSTNCYHCYQRCPTPLPCNNCATVNYCSGGCRTASWDRGGHRAECTVLNHIIDPAIGKLALLAYRILTTVTWTGLQKYQKYIENLVETDVRMDEEENKRQEETDVAILEVTAEAYPRKSEKNKTAKENREENQKKPLGAPIVWEGKYHPKDYKTVLHLTSNSAKRSFGDLFKRSITAVYLAHCLRIAGFFGSQDVVKDDMNFVASALLRHLQGSSCNAYEIGEMDISSEGAHIGPMQEIGGAIYSTISLTNHACVANAARYSIGDKCVLRAVRPIPQGKEIYDNYGFFYHSSTVNERQDTLLNQYKFACLCQACTSMWPLYPHHPDETLIFRCPAQGCQRSCCYSTSCRSRCNVCANKQQYTKLLQEIEHQLKLFKASLDQMRKGNIDSALPALLAHIIFLEKHCVEPVKHFTDVQEATKQCFSFQGNLNRPRKIAALAQVQTRSAPKLRAGKKEVIMPH